MQFVYMISMVFVIWCFFVCQLFCHVIVFCINLVRSESKPGDIVFR